MDNIKNVCWINRKHNPDFLHTDFSLRINRSYLSYIFFRKFCLGKIFSFSYPLFKRTVAHIFFLCSNSKMLRIYTIRFIAFVENKFCFRNWPIRKFIGNPMSVNLSLYIVNMFRRNSVSISSFSSIPKPARRCFINKFPEPLFNWYWFHKYSIALFGGVINVFTS